MQSYTLTDDTARFPDTPRAVALGLFDGLHIGHRAVIAGVLDVAGLSSAVLSFSDETALPKNAARLQTLSDRCDLIEKTGVDELFLADFSALADLSPAEFVTRILKERLSARLVSCGENFRFGKGGVGDVALLKTLCEAQGIRVSVAKTVLCDGEAVSSTRIRAALSAGDIPLATRLLGHSFSLTGTVEHGFGRGETLGFPTANLPLRDGFAAPRFGVYLSAVELDGAVYSALTNVGERPTFGASAPLCETTVFDYSGDLYGKELRVCLVRLLREERAFSSENDLKSQIERDVTAAKKDLAPSGKVRAVLFDFDDTLQSRPAAYKRYADRFVKHHFPSLSAEEQAARALDMWHRNGDGHAHKNGSHYIPYPVYFQELIDVWGWQNPPTIDELTAECRQVLASETVLFDDARPMMETLRKNGFTVGLITNGYSSMQGRKLDISGLRPLLDLAVVSGDEGIRKPDPEIFRRAAARLGVSPADCVYVGDHPYYDLSGATAAGMRVLYVDAFGLHLTTDVPTVTTLSQIPELLKTFDIET